MFPAKPETPRPVGKAAGYDYSPGGRLILVALYHFRLFGVASSYFSAGLPRFSPTRGRFFTNVLHSSVENPVDNVENYDWIHQLSLLIICEEPT